MPVNFLTQDQKESYGKFPDEIDEYDLAKYFLLDERDLEFISEKRSLQNKFGFALQIAIIRFLGMSIIDFSLVPHNAKRFIADQIDVSNTKLLNQYSSRDQTRREHIAQIRKFYGYRELNEDNWLFRLNRLLYYKVWLADERPSLLFDLSVSWLLHNKILLPGASTLERIISKIRERIYNRIWELLYQLPSDFHKRKLESLIKISKNKRFSDFDNYRKGAFHVSSNSINEQIKRYLSLRKFGISKLDFSKIPEIHLRNLARYSSLVSINKISRMSEEKKVAILLTFVKHYEIEAIDETLDLFDLIISELILSSKRTGQKKRLRSLKDLDQSALLLAEFCYNLLVKLDSNNGNNNQLLDFTQLIKSNNSSIEQISNSINVINEIARPNDDKFSDEMVEQHGKIKRFLPDFLKYINFESTNSGKIIFDIIQYLRKNFNKKNNYNFANNTDIPTRFINKNWNRLIYDKNNHFNQKAYILAFVIKMHDLLKRRDIYVPNSKRWNDPRMKLLQGEEWRKNKTKICHLLGRSIKSDQDVNNLTLLMDRTYKRVIDNFDDNSLIRIDNSKKPPSITIENLSKIEEPESLTILRKQVNNLLPRISLSELILEIDAHTGFCNEFTHASDEKARAKDIKTSISAVLFTESSNIGFEPIIKDNVPSLTRHRLSWTKQNFIRLENITKSNNKLVNYQSNIPIVKYWGTGEVASVDGLRFVVPVKTIRAKANKKYFHRKKGITWYNFMSDQFAGFHGVVITGTLRDSIFLLEGILEQQTGLRPTEIMTDTSGASDLIFGLFLLLGYQFSPRLADAGEEKFWRIDKNADYGVLNDIARGNINLNRVHENWDDMLRTAGSLKFGRINASELVQTLLKSDKPSSLTKAIMEIGRINKTIYLLNFIDDEDYRRRILTQLNRTESRHAVARTICHGKKGEIRKRYRDGQENQLGILGLITNAVILWNTIYIEKAVNHLKNQNNIIIKDEDIAKLSPLPYHHLNVLGDYSFTLQDDVANGKLRDLNLDFDLNFLPEIKT
ncbi:MAG: TnpA family transposase [Rickettsiales bacterium]|jgi:TnpA family transposase